MGRSETREHCRKCGKFAIRAVYIKEPGLLIRKVLCEECRREHELSR